MGRVSRVGCGGVERVRPLRDRDIFRPRDSQLERSLSRMEKNVGASNIWNCRSLGSEMSLAGSDAIGSGVEVGVA